MMREAPIAAALAVVLLALVSLLSPPRPATAQASDEQLDAILQDIEKKTDQYSRLKSLLSDPDQAKRMAALHAMTSSGIVTLQEMAMDQAFNSGDPAMQAAALQALLTKTKALNFRLDMTGQLSEETMETVAKFGGGGFSILIESWDAGTASFSGAADTYSSDATGQGQVTGLSLNYSSEECRTSVVLDGTARNMLGELSCYRFGEPVRVSLSIR
jgi:hypothetical protein